MKIIITLEVPDGTTVATVSETRTAEPVTAPPFQDEFIPFPGTIPLPGDVNLPAGYAQGAAIAQPTPVFRGVATGQVPPELCPVHHVPWKQVPAGVSKKTGNAYEAFWACSERGCTQRPARTA